MNSYRHVQRAPLCLLLYGIAVVLFGVGWFLRDMPPIHILYPPLGVLLLILAASFHHLTVEEQGERLTISFGPIPLFRRSLKYDDIESAVVGRTTILEGWGIHLSLRGGWVWNLWGRDCIVIRLQNGGTLRIGTNDAENLVEFLQHRIPRRLTSLDIDKWTETFPRLSELKARAESDNRGDFFRSLPAVLRSSLAHSFFMAIESDLSALDDAAWQALLIEFLERTPTTISNEARRASASLLNEAKGYVFLKRERYSAVSFIARSVIAGQETPDVKATLDGVVNALVEVKSIWQSDYQSDWIEQNTNSIKQGQLPTVRRIAPSFPDGLKNKLKHDLQKATSQLKAYFAQQVCRRIVYFVIYLDFEQQNTPSITTQIRDFLLQANVDKDVEIECDFQNAFE